MGLASLLRTALRGTAKEKLGSGVAASEDDMSDDVIRTRRLMSWACSKTLRLRLACDLCNAYTRVEIQYCITFVITSNTRIFSFKSVTSEVSIVDGTPGVCMMEKMY